MFFKKIFTNKKNAHKMGAKSR